MPKHGPSHRGPKRQAERETLVALWQENHKRRELYPELASWTMYTSDDNGNQVIKQLAGAKALAAFEAHDRYFRGLREKVENWNRKQDGTPDVKDINAAAVVGVLELAFALTNHPAYGAAIEAMHLHGLHEGGLRRAFKDLLQRHGHAPGDYYYAGLAQLVDKQMAILSGAQPIEPFMYDAFTLAPAETPKDRRLFRRACEHVVAYFGIPGTSFQDAVDKVRHAYADRDEPQEYLKRLHGLA